MNDFYSLDLASELITALDNKGFIKPMAIQKMVIEAALNGRDLLAQSPTGTGKTLAFALPAIDHLLANPRKKPSGARVLILTPTRDLALQIGEQIQSLLHDTSLRLATIIGGVSFDEHEHIFNGTVDIVIATPGRLISYIEQGDFNCLDVEILIFDEADRMLEMGFGIDAKIIAEQTSHRQMAWLFSATLEGELLENFAKEILTDPLFITAVPSRRERKKINQWYYHCDSHEHKIKLLAKMVSEFAIERAIVFVRRREHAPVLSEVLRKRGIRSSYLEGEMNPKQRQKALDYLKQGLITVLIATDVAARGIDIENIDFVIHFDLPYRGDTYLHRIGRTARAGKKGSAVLLVEAHDYPLLGKIIRYSEQQLKARTLKGLEPRTKAPKTDEIIQSKGKAKHKTQAKKSQAVKNNAKSAKIKKIRTKDQKNKGKRRKPSLTSLSIIGQGKNHRA